MEPTATLDAYIYFTGNCREAMTFYQQIFGGELSVLDNPEAPGKVMHSRLSGGLIPLMSSDGDRTEPYPPSFISLNISGSNEQKLRAIFDALSEGGTVVFPLKKEFWGDIFGSLTDKYGVDWQVSISQRDSKETAEKEAAA